MKPLTPEQLEAYGKKRLRELLKGEEDFVIIAGFIDYFGDGKLALCSKCGTPVLVRPWIRKAIDQHDLQVVCVCCADPQDIKGQLAMDLAKLQSEAEKK